MTVGPNEANAGERRRSDRRKRSVPIPFAERRKGPRRSLRSGGNEAAAS